MMALLAGWWAAIWPNLAASVIWSAPVILHIRSLHRKVDELHGRRPVRK